MFVTLQDVDLNSSFIKEVTSKGKMVIITDTDNERTIYYFSSTKEAKENRDRLLKELNNG